MAMPHKLSFLLFLISSTYAMADDNLERQAPRPSSLQSQLSFGYGVEDNAARGFHNAGGSLIALDLSYRVSPSWHIGLRTMGTGAEQGGQRFYRMASGPLAIYEWNTNWQISAGLAVYSETSYVGSEPSYRSRGLSYSLGWQRYFPLASSARLGLGGFLAVNRGEWTAANLSAATSSQSGSQQSLSRGMALSLEMSLF